MAGGLGDFITFYPVLAALVAKSTGPILELGCGDGSTPMLHLTSIACGRKVVTAETDPKWMAKYENYHSPLHEFHLISQKDSIIRNDSSYYRWQAGWDAWDRIEKDNWGVALVDQAPGECRTSTIKRLKGRCDYIVAHDSEEDYEVGTNYSYKTVMPLFNYIWEWRRFRPYTLVLSDLPIFHDFVDTAWTPGQ